MAKAFAEMDRLAASVFYGSMRQPVRRDVRVVSVFFFPPAGGHTHDTSLLALPDLYFPPQAQHRFWAVVAFEGEVSERAARFRGFLPMHRREREFRFQPVPKGTRLGPSAEDLAWCPHMMVTDDHLVPTADPPRADGDLVVAAQEREQPPPPQPRQPPAAHPRAPPARKASYTRPQRRATEAAWLKSQEKRAGWRAGFRLDVRDDGVWYAATVTDVDDRNGTLKVTFDGFGPQFDKWISRNSPHLAPFGRFTSPAAATSAPAPAPAPAPAAEEPPPPPPPLPRAAPGAAAPELEERVRSLERQNAQLAKRLRLVLDNTRVPFGMQQPAEEDLELPAVANDTLLARLRQNGFNKFNTRLATQLMQLHSELADWALQLGSWQERLESTARGCYRETNCARAYFDMRERALGTASHIIAVDAELAVKELALQDMLRERGDDEKTDGTGGGTTTTAKASEEGVPQQQQQQQQPPPQQQGQQQEEKKSEDDPMIAAAGDIQASFSSAASEEQARRTNETLERLRRMRARIQERAAEESRKAGDLV